MGKVPPDVYATRWAPEFPAFDSSAPMKFKNRFAAKAIEGDDVHGEAQHQRHDS
jgi:hypothetical protein